MSTDTTSQSAQTQNQSVDETQNPAPVKSQRSVEELEKRLQEVSDEAKRYRQEKSDLARKMEAAEKAKLEESGEYKTLYEKTVAQLDEEKTNAKKLVGNMALNQLKSAFRSEAMSAGCTKPEILERLIGIDRLSKVMTPSYEIDPTLMKSVIEDSQKEYDFTFAKQAPSVRDLAPSNHKPKPFAEELKSAKTQKEFDAIRKKHGF